MVAMICETGQSCSSPCPTPCHTLHESRKTTGAPHTPYLCVEELIEQNVPTEEAVDPQVVEVL